MTEDQDLRPFTGSVNCINDSCRMPLEEAWSFCPYCGTDNRPPEHQEPILDCDHVYVARHWYCVKCGEMRNSSRSQRLSSSTGFLLLGLALLGFAVFLHFDRSGRFDPDYAYVVLLFAIAKLLTAAVIYFRSQPDGLYSSTWRAPWQSNNADKWDAND